MPKKILIVEDSQPQAKRYKMVLGSYKDCNLVFAQNGLEALNQLAIEKDIDLIISDINMPKVDGLSFLQSMRMEGYTTPVIVISTKDKDDYIRRAIELGAKGYIEKPWKQDDIREIINRLKIWNRKRLFIKKPSKRVE